MKEKMKRLLVILVGCVACFMAGFATCNAFDNVEVQWFFSVPVFLVLFAFVVWIMLYFFGKERNWDKL